MVDLISRAAAIEWFFRPYSNEESYSNLDVERALKAIPAVDVVPVVHGEWMERHHAYSDEEAPIEEWQSAKCSECGKYHTTPYLYYFTEYKFCPHCGARMDGERRDDDGKIS